MAITTTTREIRHRDASARADRRRLHRSLIAFAWLAILGVAAEAGVSRPNLLWIVTDDQRSDSLACYNRAMTGRSRSRLGYVESPNVDRLASEGVLFTNAYANSMACAPSRASMITGKYPHRSGIYGFEQTHRSAGCASRMLPEVLKEHGYQPTAFGKSGVRIFPRELMNQWQTPGFFDPYVRRNDLEKTPHSDFWFNSPWGQHEGTGMVLGTEEVYRFADGTTRRFWRQRVDRAITPDEAAERREIEQELDLLRTYTRRNPDLIIGGRSPNTTASTLDGSIARSVGQYLDHPGEAYDSLVGDRLEGPDPARPLFTYVGFCFPHTPVLPSDEFRERFADKAYDVPPFSDEQADLLPPSMQKLRDDMDFSRMTDEEKQQAIRDYYAFCAMGDHLIGETVDAFKAYCERQGQEYLIVYVCGDHGWHLGEQGIEAKFTPWAQTVRCSFVVVSSDRQHYVPGTVCHDPVEFVDIAPTLYEAAGVPLSAYPGLDGIGLTTTLSDGPQREYILGEMNQVRGDWAYLRSEDFNFAMRVRPFFTKPGRGYKPGARIRWGLDAPAEEVEMILHDLRVDPDERFNVAYHEPYRELAARLRQKLASIVLGDGRVECDWQEEDEWVVSSFASGAHDRQLNLPTGIVPTPSLPTDR